MDINGKCFGATILKRSDAPNDAIQIMCEDDGNWFEVGDAFDAAWLDDLIAVLQAAKAIAHTTFPKSP